MAGEIHRHCAHQPVQVAQPGIDLQEVAELAHRLAAEGHAALGADGDQVPAESVLDGVFERAAQPVASSSRCVGLRGEDVGERRPGRRHRSGLPLKVPTCS